MISNKSYLFVDGSYLKKILKLFQEKFYDDEPDPIIFCECIKGNSEKAFYYDAYPGRKKDEPYEDYQSRTQVAEEEFSEISSKPGWHVNVGFTKGQGKRVRQKGVDVQLAIDALMHRIRGNCDHITLLAGDLDFHPLAKALVEAGAFLKLLCDPTSVSDELRQAVDSVEYITPRNTSKYVRNWPNRNREIQLTQVNDSDLPQGEVFKNGIFSNGSAEIIKSDDNNAHLIIKYRNTNSHHQQMTYNCPEKLLFYARYERPDIKWTDPK